MLPDHHTWIRLVADSGAYIGCGGLKDIFDEALTDGQDLGELALDLRIASTPTSVQ